MTGTVAAESAIEFDLFAEVIGDLTAKFEAEEVALFDGRQGFVRG
jgi:hypothetical protein